MLRNGPPIRSNLCWWGIMTDLLYSSKIVEVKNVEWTNFNKMLYRLHPPPSFPSQWNGLKDVKYKWHLQISISSPLLFLCPQKVNKGIIKILFGKRNYFCFVKDCHHIYVFYSRKQNDFKLKYIGRVISTLILFVVITLLAFSAALLPTLGSCLLSTRF
jgi:hypothetical protein